MAAKTQAEKDAATAIQGTKASAADPDLLKEAYLAATNRLREIYATEFDEMYTGECLARGIVREPGFTEEDRARQEMQRLIAKHPHLAASIAAEQA